MNTDEPFPGKCSSYGTPKYWTKSKTRWGNCVCAIKQWTKILNIDGANENISSATSDVRRNSHLTKFRQDQKRLSTLERDQEVAKHLKETKTKQYEEDDFTVNTSGCCDWFLVLIHEITVPLLFALFFWLFNVRVWLFCFCLSYSFSYFRV